MEITEHKFSDIELEHMAVNPITSLQSAKERLELTREEIDEMFSKYVEERCYICTIANHLLYMAQNMKRVIGTKVTQSIFNLIARTLQLKLLDTVPREDIARSIHRMLILEYGKNGLKYKDMDKNHE